jgi:lipoprotein-anchoring transpeptidase ErfK/SrfK
VAPRFHRQFNTAGYNYAVATESGPETLTVYHNGRVVLRSAANTGISGRGTAPGTFPVYERLRSQTMRGTNPNGSRYADFVQWIAYFNGGDAVHYIPRGSYGSPQSLGCIELPYAAAEQAWGYLTYGTLVTVLS